MQANRRTAGRKTTSASAAGFEVAQPGTRLVLCMALVAWMACSAGAQELLILGQSPMGPLLDETEETNWLERVPDGAMQEGNEPGLILLDQAGSTAGAAAESAGGAAGDFYPQGALESRLGPTGNTALVPMSQCPDCGGSMAVGCPGCGTAGGGLMGGGWLVDQCSELLQPMTRESWLYRPFSAGWFMGFMQGNALIDDWVGQEQGFFGGYRFGWDVDPYWGWEMRFGFASVALYDSDRAKAAQQAADLAKGLTPDDPYFHRFDTRRDSGVRLWDIDVVWYPYGDTYLRPYFLIGLGSGRVDFMDRLSDRRIKSVLAVPIGLGFKYRLQDWVAIRVEATDNFIAGSGSGFRNLHNFSLTAGLEVRFGGTRTGYWPYHPGRHYW